MPKKPKPEPPADGPNDNFRQLDDEDAMRVLVHPVRWTIVELLSVERTATNDRCAEVLGTTSASCAFHLRQLERSGLVTEETGPDGKQWRLTHSGESWSTMHSDPGLQRAATALTRQMVEHEAATLVDWVQRSSRYSPSWHEASMISGTKAWLTDDELRRLSLQIVGLMRTYADRTHDEAKRPPGSRPVRMFFAGYPFAVGAVPK